MRYVLLWRTQHLGTAYNFDVNIYGVQSILGPAYCEVLGQNFGDTVLSCTEAYSEVLAIYLVLDPVTTMVSVYE